MANGLPIYPHEVAMFEAGINEDTYFDDDKFEANVAKFKAFCEAKKIYYYARPRESFFMYEAMELAKAAGAEFIILEDLS